MSLTFREELQAHRAKHETIQQSLRRPSGRTYGARMESGNDSTTMKLASASGPPSILPSFNVSRVPASGSLPHASQNIAASSSPASVSTQGGATSNIHQTRGSEKHENADMDMESLHSLAQLMRYERSYLFLRQFPSLNIENLLWMQVELAELEKRLASIRSITVNDGVAKEASRLRDLIREKLQAYSVFSPTTLQT